MHRDKKVGLALGILLCSIVGAFFFRDDAPKGGVPELKDTKRLDSEIARETKRPYTENDTTNRSRVRENFDEKDLPEWLRNKPAQSTAQKNLSRDPFGPEEPGRTFADSSRDKKPDDRTAVPIPPENSDWSVAGNEKLLDEETARRKGNVTELVHTTGRVHVVADGETLSSIAGRYLGSQARYLDLYNANKDQLRSPDDLKPGMKLVIPNTLAAKAPSSPRSTTGGRAPKPTQDAATTSRTTNRPASPPPAESSESAKKPKFKPAKAGPAIRRSAEAEDPVTGKSLSQAMPIDVQEIDDALLAELEQITGVTELAAAPAQIAQTNSSVADVAARGPTSTEPTSTSAR